MEGGGKLFCALVMERGGPEKPRKAVTLKWFFSSQPECDLLAAAAPVLEGAWCWCKLGFPS